MSSNRHNHNEYKLNVASVLWLDMQGTGHAAVVNYCKCPLTQHIRLMIAQSFFHIKSQFDFIHHICFVAINVELN
jgi:hypothetical protein